MKKLMFALVFVMLFAGLYAQAPQGISHQAVIRNAANELVTVQTIGIRISILQGSAEGTAVYVETHSPTSNANGLITYVIGQGINVSGTFAQIDWAAGPYFLKNEVDPAGGTNYTITGTTQFLSVPYALFAGNYSTRPPKAIALEATEITPFSATINGIVNGEGFLTEVVFEWGETTEYGNTVTAIQSPVTGSMDLGISAELDELTPGTQYHFRVRASNAVNVTNSDNIEFSALATSPQVATNPVTNILNYSAIGGGEVTSDGGSPVTSRGVVWSTFENPTIENNEGMTNDGTGVGEFTSEMTGLEPGASYYVRAYATNSVGTVYGPQIQFTTNLGIAVTFRYIWADKPSQDIIYITGDFNDWLTPGNPGTEMHWVEVSGSGGYYETTLFIKEAGDYLYRYCWGPSWADCEEDRSVTVTENMVVEDYYPQ